MAGTDGPCRADGSRLRTQDSGTWKHTSHGVRPGQRACSGGVGPTETEECPAARWGVGPTGSRSCDDEQLAVATVLY